MYLADSSVILAPTGWGAPGRRGERGLPVTAVLPGWGETLTSCNPSSGLGREGRLQGFVLGQEDPGGQAAEGLLSPRMGFLGSQVVLPDPRGAAKSSSSELGPRCCSEARDVSSFQSSDDLCALGSGPRWLSQKEHGAGGRPPCTRTHREAALSPCFHLRSRNHGCYGRRGGRDY